jgi:NO-binding membrane sensor protein with MHYT domain
MLSRWFLTSDVQLALCVPYRHEIWLAVLSYLVAMFAAYTVFDLMDCVRAARSRIERLAW